MRTDRLNLRKELVLLACSCKASYMKNIMWMHITLVVMLLKVLNIVGDQKELSNQV